MSYFAKIYPELMESVLLCENLGVQLVNVTSSTNKIVSNITEDFTGVIKPMTSNSSVDSLSSVDSIDTSLNFASSHRMNDSFIPGAPLIPVAPLTTSFNAPLIPVAPLRPGFMTPPPRNYYFKPIDISKKRTYVDAFDAETLEDDRYGQHISIDFFVNNIGHTSTNSNDYEDEFDAYYQANRNLFNV